MCSSQTPLVIKHDLPKTKRLLKTADFSYVFNKAVFKVGHGHLLLLARPSLQPCSRIGLVIAKKHVKHAVDRNRIKRIIKESFRMLVLPPAAMGELALPNNQITSADKNTVCFNPALDIIALARPGLGQLTNAQLHALMQTQWQKLSSQQVRYNEHAS